MATSKKTTGARKTTAARRTTGPRKKELKLDGNRLVEALTAAGLDPKKLDVERTIGKAASATAARSFRNADITELNSRLRAAGSTTAAKPQWKVGVVVEF